MNECEGSMTLSIAVVTETFHPFKGGSAKRYLEVFSRLVEKGFNVDVYTVRLDNRWLLEEEYKGIRIIRSREAAPDYITRDGFRSISGITKYLTWLYRVLNPREYDVIEANHCPIFPVFLSWFKKRSRPLISTVHEVWWSDWYRYAPTILHVPLGVILERSMMSLPTHIISVSRFTTERLVNILGVSRDMITTIPNGVDLNLYRSIDSGKIYGRLVYGGRLNPHKRIDILLKSFEKLYKSFDVELDIFGDGPLRGYIVSYISRNGLSRRVYLHGMVDDYRFAYLMRRGYIYTLPSMREGQSITTLEAMAAGTPQVTVYSSGNAAYTMVLEAGSGVVTKLDPSSYSMGIKRLLEDDGLWREAREAGYRYVSRFDWDVIAEKHRIVYETFSRR